MSIPMTHFGSIVGENVMFIANIFIKMFIPSGGQAAEVMPIMVPVADLVGVTRQVAVQAFPVRRRFFKLSFSHCGYADGVPGYCRRGLEPVCEVVPAHDFDSDSVCDDRTDHFAGYRMDRAVSL